MKRSYLCLSVVCAAVMLCSLAEPGVTQDAIVRRQVAALEGPASLGGREFREGLLIVFEEANSAGGRKPRRQGSEWARNHAIG